MAEFNTDAVSVTFTADGSDFDESRDARFAVQEVPGGDNFYVDRAGRSPLKWHFGAILENDTVWGQLNQALGEAGTLSIETFDTHTAVLTHVGRPVPFADEQVKASVEFLITDT